MEGLLAKLDAKAVVQDLDSHTEQFHALALLKLCRLCGKKAQTEKERKKNIVHSTENFSKDIKDIFDLDIYLDSPQKHPTTICTKCYRLILNIKRRGKSDVHDVHISNIKQTGATIWQDYCSDIPLSECRPCNEWMVVSKGGRPVSAGAGIATDYARLTDKFHSLVKDSPNIISSNYDFVGLSDTQKRHYICCVCQDILSPRAVCTPCKHEFCSNCLSTVFPNSLRNTQSPCPMCQCMVSFGSIVSLKVANPKFYNQLLDLQVSCRQCKSEAPLEYISRHNCHESLQENPGTSTQMSQKLPILQHLLWQPAPRHMGIPGLSVCNTLQPVTSASDRSTGHDMPSSTCTSTSQGPRLDDYKPASPQGLPGPQTPPEQAPPADERLVPDQCPNQDPIQDFLATPVTEPVTKVEEKMLTHTIKRKLWQSADRTTIRLKTGGQVLYTTTLQSHNYVLNIIFM